MDQKEIVVSQMDVQHLEIIRRSVKDFTANCSANYDRSGTSLLDIAPQIYQGAKEFFKKATVKTLDINPASGADYIADLCAANDNTIPSASFDMVLCTEVLEHTLQPFDAVKEIERILKPGGLAFITVPFNFRIHGPLPDCWRFTEHGLRALFSRFVIISLTEIGTEDRDLMPIHYRIIVSKS